VTQSEALRAIAGRAIKGPTVRALFVGPNREARNTAAAALANDLGRTLYRVDVSAVSSKFIGETEKNLSVIFDEAAEANAVLFFDEADALFGKRTEVSDSHDRFANTELDYLLKRIETFTGVVILATSRRTRRDDAFARYAIVDFPD
jgi:SpoVK/Ycf46/Vps4 family AAA+-type ATPase